MREAVALVVLVAVVSDEHMSTSGSIPIRSVVRRRDPSTIGENIQSDCVWPAALRGIEGQAAGVTISSLLMGGKDESFAKHTDSLFPPARLETHETFRNAHENTSQCLRAQRARAGLWLLEFRIE